MDKNSLLKSLAEKGYNIGFGARKTFLSYGIYSKIPRFLSLCTVFVGVYQMTTRYKSLYPGTQEIVSVIIICIGILALILDAGSKDKEHYNQVGKQLACLYNELQTMYNTARNMDDHADFSPIEKRMKEIEAEVHRIAISDQVPFTHIITNLYFFYGGTQIDWINEQLHFTIKDKFPFLHYEAIILYGLLLWFVYSKFFL